MNSPPWINFERKVREKVLSTSRRITQTNFNNIFQSRHILYKALNNTPPHNLRVQAEGD